MIGITTEKALQLIELVIKSDSSNENKYEMAKAIVESININPVQIVERVVEKEVPYMPQITHPYQPYNPPWTTSKFICSTVLSPRNFHNSE